MNDAIKEQKAITETELYRFNDALNRAFKDGWRIVSGTIVATLSESERYSHRERYVAVVER